MVPFQSYKQSCRHSPILDTRKELSLWQLVPIAERRPTLCRPKTPLVKACRGEKSNKKWEGRKRREKKKRFPCRGPSTLVHPNLFPSIKHTPCIPANSQLSCAQTVFFFVSLPFILFPSFFHLFLLPGPSVYLIERNEASSPYCSY